MSKGISSTILVAGALLAVLLVGIFTYSPPVFSNVGELQGSAIFERCLSYPKCPSDSSVDLRTCRCTTTTTITACCPVCEKGRECPARLCRSDWPPCPTTTTIPSCSGPFGTCKTDNDCYPKIDVNCFPGRSCPSMTVKCISNNCYVCSSTTTSIPTCLKQGEQVNPSLGPQYSNVGRNCCPPLKLIPTSNQYDSACNRLPLVGAGSVCLPCGNGVCDSGESICNCPQDCNTTSTTTTTTRPPREMK